MDAPEKYRGRTVSVDIVEPIFWSSNGVAVEIPEHPYRLALALIVGDEALAQQIEASSGLRNEGRQA